MGFELSAECERGSSVLAFGGDGRGFGSRAMLGGSSGGKFGAWRVGRGVLQVRKRDAARDDC